MAFIARKNGTAFGVEVGRQWPEMTQPRSTIWAASAAIPNNLYCVLSGYHSSKYL
jgi:hypothetical protein